MSRHFKIDDELNDDDLVEFRQLVVRGRMTIDQLTAWLSERGHKITRTSVHRYAAHYRAARRDPFADLRAELRAQLDSMDGETLKAVASLIRHHPVGRAEGGTARPRSARSGGRAART